MNKAQPMETAPKNRPVLVKHKVLGWFQAQFYQDVYDQSIAQHGDLGGFGWSAIWSDNWLYHKDMIAWAELPEDG